MPVRSAKAQWEGNLTEGRGTMALSGGAYEGPYSFSSRFEEGKGTNPEELIAAAHAGCFSMAFSNQLAKAGFTPKRVSTTANVHLVKGEAGFSIPAIDLVTEAEVPGIDNTKFQELANAAKTGCPISKLLAAAEIKLDAKLVG
jgi:lipoyl-dependent peroxiredoxin